MSLDPAATPRARWGTLHLSTRIAAALGAVATVVVLGPVAAAVLLMRCCGSGGGASPWAWLLVAAIVTIAAAVAGVTLGALVAAVRRLATPARGTTAA